MKKVVELVFSLVMAAGSVISGGLWDVYAENPVYEPEFGVVRGTEVAVTAAEPEPEPEAEAVEAAPVSVVAAPAASVVSTPPRVTGPDLSNHLEMPGFGVNSAVSFVGINAAGEIDVPGNHVGMWNGGAMPGQAGVVFLDGHVFGVFSSLRNSAVGSEFSLTWGGVVYRYRVAQRETYSIDYLRNAANGVWAGILRTPVGGVRGLNIMTCAGVPQGNTYSQRTVVFAYQVD
jgi:prepilin-type processing-associated H-X9-DG protein